MEGNNEWRSTSIQYLPDYGRTFGLFIPTSDNGTHRLVLDRPVVSAAHQEKRAEEREQDQGMLHRDRWVDTWSMQGSDDEVKTWLSGDDVGREVTRRNKRRGTSLHRVARLFKCWSNERDFASNLLFSSKLSNLWSHRFIANSAALPLFHFKTLLSQYSSFSIHRFFYWLHDRTFRARFCGWCILGHVLLPPFRTTGTNIAFQLMSKARLFVQ